MWHKNDNYSLSCFTIYFSYLLGIWLQIWSSNAIFLIITQKSALDLLKKKSSKWVCLVAEAKQDQLLWGHTSVLPPGPYNHFKRYLAGAYDIATPSSYPKIIPLPQPGCTKLRNSEEFSSTSQTWFVRTFQIFHDSCS